MECVACDSLVIISVTTRSSGYAAMEMMRDNTERKLNYVLSALASYVFCNAKDLVYVSYGE